MLTKKYTKDKKSCKVTFSLSDEVGAESVTIQGDFTNWEEAPKKMRRYKDGYFKISINLEAGRRYCFRYQLDGERWENDWEADGYVRNDFGTEDSIVEV